MDGALGSLVKVMTRDMEVYTIAAVPRKNNATHKAKEISGVLETVYQTRYNISLKKEAAYVASDTCSTAQNVSKNLEAEQVSNVFIFQTSIFIPLILCAAVSSMLTG